MSLVPVASRLIVTEIKFIFVFVNDLLTPFKFSMKGISADMHPEQNPKPH